MTYDYRAKKITAILSDKLSPGMAMNALGHLALSAGNNTDKSFMGQAELKDANGDIHAGIAKYPFIVLKATEEQIKEIVKKAKEKGVFVVDYPQEMFDTATDEELVEAVSKAKELQYHGAVLVGDASDIKSLTGHLKLYR